MEGGRKEEREKAGRKAKKERGRDAVILNAADPIPFNNPSNAVLFKRD